MRLFSYYRLFRAFYLGLFFSCITATMAKYKGTLDVLNKGSKALETNILLNSGHQMPIVGFGTYTIQGRDVVFRSIDAALKAGYRSIDTATVYNNEEDIGAALKEYLPTYGLKREDLFLTSKLAPRDQGEGKVRSAVEASLRKLGTDYLDLYLIHWPGGGGLQPDNKENARLRNESWQGLVSLRDEGKLRSVGVSNYNPRHIRELLSSSNTPPALNQVEVHPHWLQPDELLEESAKVGTLIQAYSSLGGNRAKDLISDEQVVSIATKLNVQPAQLLLRWALQTGFGIIPKSITPERIKANTELDFVISDEDMHTLNNLKKNTKYAWNPDIVV